MGEMASAERLNALPFARIASELGQFDEITRMLVLDASSSDVPYLQPCRDVPIAVGIGGMDRDICKTR
jgi:hypothetical protein